MADIGNGHNQSPAFLRNDLRIDGIIEVPCVLAINGHERQIAQVDAVFHISSSNRLGQSLSQSLSRARKTMRHIKLANRNLNLHARVVDRAQSLDHTAHWRRVAGGRFNDLHHHHLAGLGTTGVGCADQDIVFNALVFGGHQENAALLDQAPHNIAGIVLDHLLNGCLGTASAIGADHLRPNAIAMHGLEHLAGGDKDIVPAGVGANKTKAIPVADQAAGKTR